jgi:hypothetical protein
MLMGSPTAPATRRTLRGAVRQAVLLALLMAASLGLYLAVLWWRGPHAVIVTQTAWDRLIPFRPGWVWVYLLPYVVGPVIAGLLRPATFTWLMRRGLLVVFVSLAVFILVPTKTVRPDATGLGDGPTARLYRDMAALDGPAANAAPSLHVGLSCLLAFALLREWPRWWPVSLAGVGVVWLSTLLTHQHHLVDVAAGVLLATAVALPWAGPRRGARQPAD